MTIELNCMSRLAPPSSRETSIGRRAARLAAFMGLAVALGMSGAPEVLAQGTGTAPAPEAAAAPAKKPEALSRYYGFVGLAAFKPQDNGSLQNDTEMTFANGMFGGGYRIAPDTALELAFLFTTHKLDTPDGVKAIIPSPPYQSPKSNMFTSGLAATVKTGFTAEALSPYVGAGFGLYSTRFLTTSESPGCTQNCPDTGPRVSAHSNAFGYHAVVGADFHVTRKDMVGAEFRYLWLDQDFGSPLPGTTHAGGALFWLGYRRIIP
jgi:opacity protein-like surface antigen